MAEARKSLLCSIQQRLDPLVVHYLGTVDLGFEHQALGVYQDVALTALDLLASYSITALFPAYRSSLDRLGIKYASAGLGIALQANPKAFSYGLCRLDTASTPCHAHPRFPSLRRGYGRMLFRSISRPPKIGSDGNRARSCLVSSSHGFTARFAPATLRDMLATRSLLVHDLEKLGLRPGEAAMVHCRMSALGHVVGGAETVVRALLDVLGPAGTLMAYTGWQDEPPDDLGDLDEERRRAHLEEHPAYDPRVALSRRDHGRVAEALRTWPGSRHSGHPEAGVAAMGPLATMITAGHPRDDAYGAGTPYARLVEFGGQVALLGAPLDSVTLVHHAEAVARVPGKRRVSYGMPVLQDGGRVWRTFSDIDTSEGALSYERLLGEEDYIEHIARSALAAGVGRSGPVGEGIAHLFEAQGLVEHAVAWIEQNFASGGATDL